MAGRLYVVATPIGNLNDMTTRAIDTLKSVDMIAAEDTRTSMVLLHHFEIKNKLVSYHRHNEDVRAGGLVYDMLEGKNIALITDAGTPCISDPGYLLVKQAVDAGIEVVGVCGASAALTALSISAFSLRSYSFYGFLPRKRSEIIKDLEAVAADHTHIAVFYESPRRIQETISCIQQVFPSAELCLCNDLTKKFERIYRGTAASVLEQLEENPDYSKGEYTIVLNKNYINENLDEKNEEDLSIEAMLTDVMVKQACSLKEAIKYLFHEKKGELSKKNIYAASLHLKRIMQTGEGEAD